MWHIWLRYCAIRRQVAGDIPYGIIRILHWFNPSSLTMALGPTQRLTEMSATSTLRGKRGQSIGLTTLRPLSTDCLEIQGVSGSWSQRVTKWDLRAIQSSSISNINKLLYSVQLCNSSHILTLILRRSRTGTVWFYTSTSNKRAARPKLYTNSLTRDLKRMYSRLILVRITINL